MAEQIALFDKINPTAQEAFAEAGFEVVTFDKSITQPELAALTDTARGLGVRSGPEVTQDAMGIALEVITVYGGGTNHVTLTTEDGRGADDRGIPIFNAAHENTRAVAELVIGSAIALMRGFHTHDRSMQAGVWSKGDGRELRNSTMGIIGYGTIGSQVATLAEDFGMDVVAYDPVNSFRAGRAQIVSSPEAVLEAADIVTLHVPGGDANRKLINAERLALMKPGSFLINAARGELVNYAALLTALGEGQLAGAAIDVYADKNYSEPEKGQPFDHPLRGHPKVLCLPHIGGSTQEAQAGIGSSVARKALAYLATGNTMGSVNIPQLPLEDLRIDTSRLLNIHDNRPGVMAELTTLLADHDLNVVQTAQNANEQIGYAAFDVEGVISDDALVAIQAFKSTRNTRVVS